MVLSDKKKVIIVMPAYNAAATLEKTYKAIPEGSYDNLLLVDDCSKDNTVEIAKKLGLKVIVHGENKGYGGNQKTCYTVALKEKADIVVMLHPDFQYDPSLVPEMVKPIAEGKADIVYGSRMLVKGMAKKGGMPWWRRVGNRALTIYFNTLLGTKLTDVPTGYISYSRKVLESVPFMENDNDFCFDEEVIIQARKRGFRMAEIPIPTRYEEDSSSLNIKKAIRYQTLLTIEIILYYLHRARILDIKKFR